MMNRGTLAMATAAAIVAVFACGDDDPSGPEFGDLEFQPDSPIEIGLAREVQVELFNLSAETLGPINVGTGFALSIPDEIPCIGFAAEVAPMQIQSIAPDQSALIDLTFDFSGLSEEDCPLATYAVVLNAAVGIDVLGSAQIRLDHTAVE